MRTDLQSAQSSLQFFSTDDVAPSARVSRWTELTCKTFTEVSIDPLRRGEFGATLTRTNLQELGLAEVWSAASTVHHTATHVRQLRGGSHYLMHLQLAGSSINTQGGNQAHLHPGDFTICDTGRPFSLAFDESARFLILHLPTVAFSHRVPNASDLVGLRVSSTNGTCRLAVSFLQRVFSEAADPAASAWLEQVGDVSLELVAMSLRNGIALHELHDTRKVTFDELLHYVRSHLADPSLNVRSIAANFEVTPRCIQRIFASHGMTPGHYVLQTRLNTAAERLIDGSAASVTDAALDVGFGDVSYFGRTFRRSFGVSPREYRHRYSRSSRDRSATSRSASSEEPSGHRPHR